MSKNRSFIEYIFPWLARDRASALAEIHEVAKMSDDEARRTVEALIRDPDRFQISSATLPWSPDVHATVSTLLKDIEELRATRGELVIARELVQPVETMPAWDRVGTDVEHLDIIVNRETGRVLEFDGDKSALDGLVEYPSVFHFIVKVDRDVWDTSP